MATVEMPCWEVLVTFLTPLTEPTAPTSAAAPPHIRELVITLFELGREITAVLNLDELLQKIPQLIARITKFQAFAVYLLDLLMRRVRIFDRKKTARPSIKTINA